MDQAAYTSLTDRQRECLRLVARDRDSKEIARLIGKSPETVNAHIKASLARLGHSSRFTAARELQAFETTYPSLVNPPRVMVRPVPVADPGAVDYAGRPVTAIPVLRDGSFGLADARSQGMSALIDGHGGSASEPALRRLTLAAALTVLIALSIIAAVPMSDAFERFADLLRPYLNR